MKIESETKPTDRSQDDEHLSRGRRRFLRGTSIALPAVMTLHIQSASAVANGTLRQCSTNNANENVGPGVTTTNTDGLMRKEVTCYEYVGSENADYASFSPVFLDSSGDFDTVVRSITLDGQAVAVRSWDMENEEMWQKSHENPQYALVRFDVETGLPASLGVGGERVDVDNGIAASAGGACMMSVMGVAG